MYLVTFHHRILALWSNNIRPILLYQQTFTCNVVIKLKKSYSYSKLIDQRVWRFKAPISSWDMYSMSA